MNHARNKILNQKITIPLRNGAKKDPAELRSNRA